MAARNIQKKASMMRISQAQIDTKDQKSLPDESQADGKREGVTLATEVNGVDKEGAEQESPIDWQAFEKMTEEEKEKYVKEQLDGILGDNKEHA